MTVTNDTLKDNLEENAQALGKNLLRSSVGIKTKDAVDEIFTQASNIALEWATQDTSFTPSELEEYIKSPEYQDAHKYKTATKRYFDTMNTFKEMREPYTSIRNALSTKRNSIYFVREETEQNAWRMAYFIKEMRMSELQKKHNEPIDNEQMLLENLTKNDMQSIKQSYDHIKRGLATIYAWQDFITFLSEYFEIEELTEIIETDAPSEAPIQSLRAEAGRTQVFITNYAFKWEEHDQLGRVTAEADIDAKIEYYMPLIMFGSLVEFKRTDKKSYKKITSAYADYTVEEIAENLDKILADFIYEILKQNEGG